MKCCVCVCGGEQGHITAESEIILTAAWVLQIHTSIPVFVTGLCSPFQLDLIKPTLHFQPVLVVFSQSQCTGSVGQSEQTALVGRRGFVENDALRGGA